MTDGPQQCALPGCDEMVEQPEDGGPRRLYCSPAHRAAARKARHAARMDAAPAVPAATDITQPIAQAPKDEPSEQPTNELPAPLGVDPRREEPEPAAVPDREWSPAAAWTVAPPTLPSPRTVRTITSKRVKKRKPVRMAGDRQSSGTHIGRRAIASVAIASLVAGGASYFVTQNVIPTTPTPLPPQAANQPSMDADVWADKAQVVLASLSSQLDAVAQAEASWLALPAQRRAQEPAAVQALKDRKALLEQQRAILMSQLEAFKALPERTSELTSAQAQLDAVERTLTESTTTAASPDYKEALRQLESQREIVRQQRDHAAQALTDLRNGVDQALSSPLPAEKDETSPIVERVKAVVAGRPDPGEKDDDQEHKAADGQDPATTPRREDGDKERGDVGTTAPPDPERPNTPDILADGGRSQDSKGDDKPESAGQSENAGQSEGPVQSVAGSLNRALGQGDTSNRDERANKRETRGDQGDEDRSNDEGSNSSRGNSGGGLGDVVRGVSGALLGGSDRDDDGDDDSSARRGSSDSDRSEREDRDDDSGSKSDRSGWGSDRDDDSGDDRGSRRDRDDDDDDRGLVRGITDGLLGGDRDDDEDSDRKRPSGKAERQRDKDRGESKHDSDKSDSDEKDSDSDERADGDNDRKRPSGKAERQRDKDRGESKHDSDKSDSDEKDSDDDEDSGKHEDRGSDDDSDEGDSDKGKDRGDSDDDSDDDSDKGDSDKGDSDKGKDDGDSDDDGGDDGDDGGKSDKKDKGDGDSDSGDSDSGDSGSGDSDSGGDDD